MGIYITGVESYCLGEMTNSFGQFALCGQDCAQVIVSQGLLWIEAKRGFVLIEGIVVTAFLPEDPSPINAKFEIIWVEPHECSEGGVGFGEPALFEPDISQAK